MYKIAGIVLLLFLLGSIYACSSTATAPVTARAENKQTATSPGSARYTGKQKSHTVTKGETLYSIAWRYGHDYKTLASWNVIKSPFVIYPGQVIRLKPVKRRRAAQPPPVVKKQTRQRGKPAAKPQTANRSGTTVTGSATAVRWQWPARGKLLKSSSPTAEKGISIGGRTGQKIVAAATGKVVYSGSGLRGYGKLIIIKHSNTYLSAYAHNRELIVKEGETVKAGQQISTMGLDSKGASVLHFEIRKNGKPINPLGQLPRS